MTKNGFKVRFLSEAEAAHIEPGGRVPVYRVRYKTCSLMCWAERNEALRGVKEIRFEGDGDGGNGEALFVRAKSDA